MKSLTLEQLARAIQVVSKNKKFAGIIVNELIQAYGYMTRKIDTEPRDPREILVAAGCQW